MALLTPGLREVGVAEVTATSGGAGVRGGRGGLSASPPSPSLPAVLGEEVQDSLPGVSTSSTSPTCEAGVDCRALGLGNLSLQGDMTAGEDM